MGYAIIACCCEENYLHNVRRAINDIKMNIEETKPKIMNNINHLLRYDRTKLNKKMFEDFKFSLNKIKVKKFEANYWSWYLRMDDEHYLFDILCPMLEYSRNGENIVEAKKYWLKKAKKLIDNADDDMILYAFDNAINKYGKLNKGEIYINVEIENSFHSKGEENDNLLDFISK